MAIPKRVLTKPWNRAKEGWQSNDERRNGVWAGSCFCADVLAHLSYGTLEEPLWVVHNLNRLISVRGATLAAQLKSLLQLPPDTDQHTPVARERLGDTEPASPATAAAAPSTTELTSPALRTPTRAKGAEVSLTTVVSFFCIACASNGAVTAVTC